MEMLLRIFTFGIVAFVLALSVPVHANGNKEKAEAKAAFLKGIKLYDSGKYSQASKIFHKAYAISPHWKLLYNIAQCEAASKNYGLALESFESYLVSGGDEVPETRQDEVRREIARLRDLCGDVEIDAPSGSDVFINDFKRGRTPISGGISVGSGTHVLRIVKNGNTLLEQEIRVRGAKTLRIQVDDTAPVPAAVKTGPPEPKPKTETEPSTEPEPVSTELPDSSDDPPLNRLLVLGSVLTAVGGATMIAGVVTGGVSRAKTKELEKACPDKQCSDSDSKTLHDEAATLSLATDVMLPTGAAIAIAGVVLVVIGVKKESADESNAGFSVSADSRQVGAVFYGRF